MTLLNDCHPADTSQVGIGHDIERSRRLCRRVKGDAGLCYSNARKAALLLDCIGVRAVYVEGYAVSEFLPAAVLHAWIEVDDADDTRPVILDPTESYCFGNVGAVRYFPAWRMTPPGVNHVRRVMSRRTNYGLRSFAESSRHVSDLMPFVLAQTRAQTWAGRNGPVISEDVLYRLGEIAAAQVAGRMRR